MDMKEAIEFLEGILEVTGSEEEINYIIKKLQMWEELKERLSRNPYPEDIFLPISKEDFNKINNWLKKEMGFPIDRLSGYIGRYIYNSINEIIKERE